MAEAAEACTFSKVIAKFCMHFDGIHCVIFVLQRSLAPNGVEFFNHQTNRE
jgi:hypothetical protein